jgi:hypothetical protein
VGLRPLLTSLRRVLQTGSFRDDVPSARTERFRNEAAVVAPRVASTVVKSNKRVRGEDDADEAPVNTELEATHVERPAEAPGHASADVKQRDRRLFGALLGHLKRAKSGLESDAVITKQETRQAAAAERNREESLHLRESAVAEVRAKKEEALRLRDELFGKRRVTETKLLVSQWRQYHTSTEDRGYLITETYPPLMYKPVKLNAANQSDLDALLAANASAAKAREDKYSTLLEDAQAFAERVVANGQAKRAERREAAAAGRGRGREGDNGGGDDRGRERRDDEEVVAEEEDDEHDNELSFEEVAVE